MRKTPLPSIAGLMLITLALVPRMALADDFITWFADPDSGCRAAVTGTPPRNLGMTWKGNCVDGKIDGRGILEWSLDGQRLSRWEGSFKAGSAEGLLIDDGPSRRSEAWYREGRQSGRCVIDYKNGRRYDGQCVDEKPEGRGRMKLIGGDLYEGDFHDGQFHGRGIYRWASGEFYEGDWVEGNRTGRGRTVWPDGRWHEGEYRNDKRDGEGQMVFANGAWHRGNYRDGYPDGYGTYVGATAEGVVLEATGDWISGCLSTPQGTKASVLRSRADCYFD